MIGFDSLRHSPEMASTEFGLSPPSACLELRLRLIWLPSLRLQRSETVGDDHGPASFSFKFWPYLLLESPIYPLKSARIPADVQGTAGS